jgi:uncharacterized membrane protein
MAKHRFLQDESSKWVNGGLISAETRDGILSSYISTRKLPAVIWALGLSMIGLGILSFVAANWNALGRLFKIVLLVGLYGGSVAGACICERRGRKTASELLIFLSGFLLLGGIALMSQVFHISGSLESLLLTWLIVYLPTLLIVRNLAVFISYEIVTLFYLNAAFSYYMEYKRGYYYYDGETSAAFFAGPAAPFLLTALLAGIAWRMWAEQRKLSGRSAEPWVKYVFIGGSTRRIFFCNFLILNWFTWMCIINSRYEVVWPYILGVLAIGACIIFAGGKLDAADLEWQGLLIAGAAGMSLTFEFAWRNVDFSNEYTVMILASVLLGAYLVSRIIRRQRGGGFSTFLFCALLARWYFDLFFTFMDTSIFFISGGVFLLLVAFAYKKWNKLGGRMPDTENGGDGDENAR